VTAPRLPRRVVGRATQRRLPHSVMVRFPDSYDQVPKLAGITLTMRYPTAKAAETGAREFEAQGCTIVPADAAARPDDGECE
jgi:hypothetical protein